MPQPRRFSSRTILSTLVLSTLVSSTLLVGFLGLGLPAGADWLITQESKLIETRGAWTIEAGTVTYTDTAGEKQQVAVSTINLGHSEKLTAMKAAKSFVPRLPPRSADPAFTPAPPGADAAEPRASSEEPQVVLYMTSWCGYCRRTSQLLKALGVDYIAKDIEKDPAAAEAYRKGGYRGIPIIDIGGNIVQGFKPTLIHNLVQRLKDQEATAAEAQAAQEGPSS